MRDLTLALILHGDALRQLEQALRTVRATKTDKGKSLAWHGVGIARDELHQYAYELALACHEYGEPIPKVPGMLPIFFRIGEVLPNKLYKVHCSTGMGYGHA